MEQAIITKSGSGWKLNFNNGKNPTIINWTNIPADWDNTSIIVVKRDKSGLPIELKKGGITLNKPAPILQKSTQHDNSRFNPNNYRERENFERPNDSPNKPNNNNIQPNKSAKSPYNFVPLNKTIIYPDEQNVFFDKFDNNRNTGYISLEIKNLTDLMISKGVDSNSTHDFLRIGKDNRPIIPGSSLRGLIKKMVGLLSYSKLIEGEHYDDHALFYRGVADKAFTEIYQAVFFDVNDNFNYMPLAGYLSKEGNNYKIYPAVKSSSDVQYYKIRNTAYAIRIDPITKKPVFKFENVEFEKYDFRDIYFNPSNKVLHSHTRFNPKAHRDEVYKLKYALVTEYSFTQKPVNPMGKGTLVVTGGMGRKKHDQWIINLVDSNAMPLNIPVQVIKDYKSDNQRDEEFDILEELKGCQNVPCFYLTDETGIVTSFGHTPLYRIKHSNTIKDAIQQTVDNTKLDFEQLIFGDTEHFASRVYFEDAILVNNQNTQAYKTLIKILASPKPTSHQLYLKQDNMPLKTWSSEEIKISGTKEYWHKNVNSEYWKDTSGVVTKSHAGYIKPIKPNNTFIGKIRFENLTDKELGALLFSLELPPKCCHKIGMGKPLGLGTILIRTKMMLDKRGERYSQLLDQDGKFHFSSKTDLSDFKKTFSDFMLSKVGNGKTDLWDVDRLSQLKAMLEYDETLLASINWLNETRYMEIERKFDDNGSLYTDPRNGNPKPYNEYKDRNVLDTPKNILAKFKKP